MTLSSSDDCIIFTTENNQIMKVNVNVEKPLDDSKYEYLIYPFHSRAIQGMDICIKKNLVATCSIDKSVRIWNNTNPPTLEICEVFHDEAYSVAFHPSGFHLVVGFTDRIRMMNVLQKSLKTYNVIPIKGCRELRFSNGGHLIACASQSNINVYKFYTGENTPEMIYKAHLGPVRCLHWLDDDSGFISGGWDGNVFTWKLNLSDDAKDENPKSRFCIKNF
jgi:WD40 repeat protein